MLEILPIKLIRDEDAAIFGKLAANLAKLAHFNLSVADGIVITAPELHLKTILEHHDFGSREVFEQSLTLVKKDIEKIAIPEILEKETKSHSRFYSASQETPGSVVNSVKQLWAALLQNWLEQIKTRLWSMGFHKGISENLDSQIVIFTKKLEAFGEAFYDPTLDEVVVNTHKGKIHPNDLKKIEGLVVEANKKLFIPHKYQWIIDKGIKLSGVSPYTPVLQLQDYKPGLQSQIQTGFGREMAKSTVKVFLDLSSGFTLEKEVDGIYISSEKIFDLNRPQTSFEELVFKLVEVATTFPSSPVLLKLADISEGMGKIRGTLRLLHQESLFQPLVDALDFVRYKKELKNVHIVIPFIRTSAELLQIKRDLAIKKLMRKNSLEFWLEVAVPENIINLEDYLITGVDGVVLNLDELSAYFAGYDHSAQELAHYKHEVTGLLKFLEDGIKLMHKSKIPFIAYGALSLNTQVVDFLVEKGVYGIVVERYEAPSIVDLLRQAEKRMILRRAS